jgi:RNA polymerase sigma factor (sigma-70 family)
MDWPQALQWDVAMVTDALNGVCRTLHLRGDQAHAWRTEAWEMLLVHGVVLHRSFRGESSPRTFIGAVLYHHAVDWLRRSSHPRDAFDGSIVSLDEAFQFLQLHNMCGVADPLIAAADVQAHDDDLDRLHAVVDRLSAGDRLLIVEHYLRGRTLADIASEIGCTHAAARQRVHRAVGRLRKLIRSQMFIGA